MSKMYVFELTKEDIFETCLQQVDCMNCPLIIYKGVCAKDLVREDCNYLKDLLKFLLKEIDYDSLRVVKKQSRTEGDTGESKEKNADICE